MITIQWFQAFLLILGLIVSSIVVIANYRKANREQQDQNNENWAAAVDALKAHNDALVERLKDAEALQATQSTQVGILQGAVLALEKERAAWTRRNLYLYDLVQDYRAQLARLGRETPEPNGGD